MPTIDPYTITVVALVVISLPFVFWSQYRLWKVLNDPNHPYHDDYNEIIAEQSTDYWWRHKFE